MPDELEADFELVKKLKHLSTSFQKGWRKLHPIAERHKDEMRKALGRAWQEQRREGRLSPTKQAKHADQKKGEQAELEQKKQQAKNQSHSH